MDKFKFDNYKKDKGIDLRGIEELNADEIMALVTKIRGNFNLGFNDNLFLSIKKHFPSKSFEESSIFDGNELFNALKMSLVGKTFLVWNEKNVDKIDTSILIENWDYIWYGTGDDALILFQNENNKLALVTHYGSVFTL